MIRTAREMRCYDEFRKEADEEWTAVENTQIDWLIRLYTGNPTNYRAGFIVVRDLVRYGYLSYLGLFTE